MAIQSCNSKAMNYQTVKSLTGLFRNRTWRETNSLLSSHEVTHLFCDGNSRHNTKMLFEMFQVQKILGQKAQGYWVPYNHGLVYTARNKQF